MLNEPRDNENETGDPLPNQDTSNLEDAEWTTYYGHYDDSDRTEGQRADIDYPKNDQE